MKIEKPGGHSDQLLRCTRWHHVQLSAMADTKANILLTMSAVVITLSAPHISRSDFQWPFLALIVFSLITIMLAAYAVMPKFPFWRKKNLPPPDIHSSDFNILFFGDFLRLNYQQFEEEMGDILNDPSKVYEVQVREVYILGRFLAKQKYRFLRLAYFSFITGLVLSFLLMLFVSHK
ncbi:MAG: Pycsar system effector family protein [Verrucomicrobiota bacterium]